MDTSQTTERTIDEQLRWRFEQAWQQGGQAAIEQFLLDEGDPQYLATLEELVHIDLEFQWKARGEVADGTAATLPLRNHQVEHYLERFPRLNQPAVVRRLLEQEYRVRHRFGDRPEQAEYHKRFPEYDVTYPSVQGNEPAGGFSWSAPHAPPGYEILGCHARGGMGVVLKARQKGLNRLVALKMILAGIHADQEELSRFQREAEVVARLQHPHVVQIHEVGQVDGHPYLALEFVEGGDLAKRLAGVPQPAQPSALLVETLARAIHCAHERGIVHRDLKPANILLAPVPEASVSADSANESGSLDLSRWVPKITDFGLAKLMDATAGMAGGRTATGQILGTPSYMAPEQTRGIGDEVGPPADVYALGAILYDLLTGRPPFKAATALETMELVRSAEPVPPSSLQPGLPRDLETICLKCLHKEPTRRYASALALAEDLRRFLDRKPIQARPVSRWEHGWKWVRRHPAIAALGTACVVGAASLAVATVSLHTANEREARARTRAEHNFQLARDAVDRYLTRISQSPALKARGLQTLRRDLLREALTFYEQFLQETGITPELEVERGLTYGRLARISNELGLQAEAIEFFHKAEAVFRSLIETNPNVADYQKELAQTYNNLAVVHRESQRHDQSIEFAERARVLWEELVARHPEVPSYQKDLAGTYGNLGLAQGERNQTDAAYEALRRAQTLQESLIAAHPNEPDYGEGLADTFGTVAYLRQNHGQLVEGKKAFEQALPLYQRLASERPDEPRYRQRLAQTWVNVGILQMNTGQLEQARDSFEKALPVYQRLADSHPEVPMYSEELAANFFNLGYLNQRIRQAAKGRTAYQQALAIYRRLSEARPDVPFYQARLAQTYYDLGISHGSSGEMAQAQAAFEQSLPLYQRLARDYPRVPSYRDEVVQQRIVLADALARLGRHRQAIDAAEALARTA